MYSLNVIVPCIYNVYALYVDHTYVLCNQMKQDNGAGGLGGRFWGDFQRSAVSL